MQTKYGKRIGKAGLAALLATVLAAAAGDTLNIRSSVAAQGDILRLGELVQDSNMLPEGWGDRAILKAPPLGKSQQITLASIAYALQKYPDMGDVSLRGATRVSVQRQGQTVDPAAIHAAIQSYVETQELWKETETRLDFEAMPRDLSVGMGTVGIEVTGYETSPGNSRCIFKVDVRAEGVLARTLSVPARVLAVREVWVAARDLRRGLTIGPEDVRLRSLPVEAGKAFILATESIVGMELEKTVTAEQPIGRAVIREPVCAERGAAVQVAVRRGNLEVVLKARALCSGRRGDRIMCMNEQSKRQIPVRLTGDKQGVLTEM